MQSIDIRNILEKVANGEIGVDDAILKLKMKPFEEIGYAKIDTHRALRQGITEVIYGSGKTKEQIVGILQKMKENSEKSVLVTRIEKSVADYIGKYHEINYNELGKIALIGENKEPDGLGKIVVATGGTSDMYVAEEASVTAEALGNEVIRLYDVGVAGLHRLLSNLEVIMTAKVIIAIAGMEGALASVIGGLADCPVIAVPTSVGYGTSLGGVTALLSMLNSCASGVSVVNIDNGFGAGYLASMINHMK